MKNKLVLSVALIATLIVLAGFAHFRSVAASETCTYSVLILYADGSGAPAQLQTALESESGISSVSLFDAVDATPDLATLQQYDIVVAFSNSPFLDSDTLGNNLADYVDGGGVVVQQGFSFYGPDQAYGVNGRWVTNGYSPYIYSTTLAFTDQNLGTFDAGHPLMQGVSSLANNYHNVVTLEPDALEVAAWDNGDSLIAVRTVGTHTTVGMTGYIGVAATSSGDFARVIANAGRWLKPCEAPSPTPSPTAEATPTPTPEATPTPTPEPTPTPTPEATPTPTPEPTPTPTPATTPTPAPSPTGTPQIGPPTNAAQCRNGGWRIFNTPRTFSSQGDCISFVNHGH